LRPPPEAAPFVECSQKKLCRLPSAQYRERCGLSGRTADFCSRSRICGLSRWLEVWSFCSADGQNCLHRPRDDVARCRSSISISIFSQAWTQHNKSYSSWYSLVPKSAGRGVCLAGRAIVAAIIRATVSATQRPRPDTYPTGRAPCVKHSERSCCPYWWGWVMKDLAEQRRSPPQINPKGSAWKRNIAKIKQALLGKMGEHRFGERPSKNPVSSLKPFYISAAFKYQTSDRFEPRSSIRAELRRRAAGGIKMAGTCCRQAPITRMLCTRRGRFRGR